MTRILITHRAQPARQADRVIRIDGGKVIPVIQSAKAALAS
jgi:ABC-type bacteriocin/lantibiotic exporter with double-glycine peptidase domain